MKFQFNNQTFIIDGYLASALDSLVYNIKDDWDFVIVISGDRTVRVGKSVLGITVCAYLAYRLNMVGHKTKYDDDDIYFESQTMLKDALQKPKFAINHYDEGREGLDVSKHMKDFQKDLLDFFAECGQLNQLFVIVLPDFFRLKEEIAVPRSEFLLNVYRKEEKRMVDLYKTGEKIPVVKFKRGQFEFFNRRTKQNLFDKSQSTHRKNYGLIKANFVGSFSNQWPIDEEIYKKKKQESLARFQEKKKDEKEKIRKTDIIRDTIVVQKAKQGMKQKDIVEYLEENFKYVVSERMISTILQRNKTPVKV